MVKFPGELLKSGGDGGVIQGRDRFGLQNFASGVLGIGACAQGKRAFVLFIFGHEEVLHAGGPADDEHEKARGNGIERTAVPDFTLVKAATNKIDDIVGGPSGGLIGEEEAVELRDHEMGRDEREVGKGE